MKDVNNRDLEQMKSEYDQIPVPEQAKKRIEKGILMAKQEKKKESVIRILRNTGTTAAAALLFLTVMVNTNQTVANAMEQIPVLGEISKVVTFRTYENKTNQFEAKIDVPKVSVNDREDVPVNRSIEEYANDLIARYEQEVQASQAEDGQGHYAMDSTYDVVTDNDKYLSIRIRTTVIMASGAEYVKIFTVDKATGEAVTLDQLFSGHPDYKKAVSDNIKEQMTQQMAADDSKVYFYNSPEPMGDEFEGISGNESFYFNSDGELVIAFDEYAVAPGYMGAVEFTIPKSITGDLLHSNTQ